MLLKDFQLQFVPYTTSISPYNLTVAWKSVHAVSNSLTLGSERGGVNDFMREIGERLLLRSEVWLYLMFNDEHCGQGPFMVFEITGVQQKANGTLVQSGSKIDHVPVNFPWQNSLSRETELDVSRVIHVVLPDAYPVDVLAKVISDLSRLDSFAAMSPWPKEQESEQSSGASLWDREAANRTLRLRRLQVARAIGWNAREEFLAPNTFLSGYYRALRSLQFLHFIASMRERVERAVKQVLTIAGSRCGFSASVVANGVYTAAEVEDLITLFKSGGIEIPEVSKIQFGRSEVHTANLRRKI